MLTTMPSNSAVINANRVEKGLGPVAHYFCLCSNYSFF